jgi:DNA-binding MarR family transcriptional regulator
MNEDVRSALDGLRSIVQALRASGAGARRTAGVSGAQLFVLQQLAGTPGASVNDLAARTHTHQSSVSVVVARLVARGLVRRDTSEQDRRRVTLRLTPAGRALLRRAPATAQERLVEALGAMPARPRRQLAQGLTRLAAAMDGAGLPPPLFFEGGGHGAR